MDRTTAVIATSSIAESIGTRNRLQSVRSSFGRKHRVACGSCPSLSCEKRRLSC